MKATPQIVKDAIARRLEGCGIWQKTFAIKMIDDSFNDETGEFFTLYRYTTKTGRTFNAKHYTRIQTVEVD